MRKLVVTAAVAALVFAASAANAGTMLQRDPDGNLYILDTDAKKQWRVRAAENGAQPADCPEGGFWQAADRRIRPGNGHPDQVASRAKYS